MLAVVLVLLIRPGNDVAAAQPTPELTVEATQAPTPSPTPAPQIPIGLYAPDGNGVRYRMSEYISKWQKGKDIDCFEVLVSDAATLTGKNFYSICKECWGTLPDPYAMKIGYTLADGQEISMTIRKPGDITHTEYVECYLYDSDDLFDASGAYTGPWHNEIFIRRKA